MGDAEKNEKAESLTEITEMMRSMNEKYANMVIMMSNQEKLMKAQSTQLKSIENRLSREMCEVKDRLSIIEKPPYDPERTLVLTGIKPNPEISDSQKIKNLIEATGVSCSIRNIKRLTPSHDQGIGLVKCELNSVEEKIAVLKQKQHMIKMEQGSWVRSSKSHIERVTEMNFKTILSIIPGGDGYTVAGNGKLIPKPEEYPEDDSYNDTSDQKKEMPRGASMRGGRRGNDSRNYRGGYRGRGHRGRGRGPRGGPRGGPQTPGRGYGRGSNAWHQSRQTSQPNSADNYNNGSRYNALRDESPTPAEAYGKSDNPGTPKRPREPSRTSGDEKTPKIINGGPTTTQGTSTSPDNVKPPSKKPRPDGESDTTD